MSLTLQELKYLLVFVSRKYNQGVRLRIPKEGDIILMVNHFLNRNWTRGSYLTNVKQHERAIILKIQNHEVTKTFVDFCWKFILAESPAQPRVSFRKVGIYFTFYLEHYYRRVNSRASLLKKVLWATLWLTHLTGVIKTQMTILLFVRQHL